MHSYHYPRHEQEVAALARAMGFPQVSVSHEVSPLIKLVGRGDTTVVDAYLSPILRRYVARVAGELGAGASDDSPLAMQRYERERAASSPSPRDRNRLLPISIDHQLPKSGEPDFGRGEGRGEGASSKAQTRGEAPSPGAQARA